MLFGVQFTCRSPARRLDILIEGASLVLVHTDPDQIPRLFVAARQAVEDLVAEILLNDLTLEGDTVFSVLGQGCRSFECPTHQSNISIHLSGPTCPLQLTSEALSRRKVRPCTILGGNGKSRPFAPTRTICVARASARSCNKRLFTSRLNSPNVLYVLIFPVYPASLKIDRFAFRNHTGTGFNAIHDVTCHVNRTISPSISIRA